MTKKALKSLFNKKGWTGKELGKLEIENMVFNFRESKKRNYNQELFDVNEFRQLIRTLPNAHERQVYKSYTDLHDWLTRFWGNMDALYQEAKATIKTLHTKALTYNRVERARMLLISYAPKVMTEAQYKRQKRESIKKYMSEELLPEFSRASILGFMFECFRKSSLILPLEEKYGGQQVSSKLYAQRYPRAAGIGEYVHKENKEKAPTLNEYLITHKGEISRLKMIELARNDESIRVFKNGECIYKDISEIEKERREGEPGFKYFDGLIEYLNKWEAIKDDGFLMVDIYPVLAFKKIDYVAQSDKQRLTDLIDFMEEFSELTELLIEEINSSIPGLMDAPLEDWIKPIKTPQELYKEKLSLFRDFCSQNMKLAQGYGGIAFYREEDEEKRHSNLIELYDGVFKSENLSLLLQDTDKGRAERDLVTELRAVALTDYSIIKGFNFILDLLAEVYEVESLKTFKFDLEYLDLLEINLNRVCALGYDSLLSHAIEANEPFSEEEQKDMKLKAAAYSKYFNPLELYKIEITEEEKAPVLAIKNNPINFSKYEEAITGLILAEHGEGK